MTDKFQTAFNFLDRDTSIRNATKTCGYRPTYTVDGTVNHALVHTANPNVTIHHVVTAASPHPERARTERGDYFMVAYVSIPDTWLARLTPEIQERWDVSFVGPAGKIMFLPPVLQEYESILGSRYYVGFDFLYLLQSEPAVKQPTVESLKDKIIQFVTELRGDSE